MTRWTEQDVADYQAKRKAKGGRVEPGKGGVSHASTGKREVRSGVGNPAPSPYDSKTEEQYATYLWNLKMARELEEYRHHPWTFLLPGGVKWTPDFFVVAAFQSLDSLKVPRFQIHEVKGNVKMKNARDGITRFRIARGLFPWWTFKLIELSHGQWRQIE